MEKRNLDDLIIDNSFAYQKKSKSILTFIALGILIVLGAVIFTKFLLKDPGEIHKPKEKIDDFIDPSLTLEREIAPPKTPSNTTPPTKPEPKTEAVKNTAKATKPSMPNNPKETPKTNQGSTASQTEVKNTDVHTPSTPDPHTNNTPSGTIAKNPPHSANKQPVKQTQKTEKIIPKVPITEEFSQKPKTPSPKQQIASNVKPKTQKHSDDIAKPQQKPTQTPQKKAGYYIQVGSFTQGPSRHFLSILQKNGYKYHITPADARGLKKLRIGPYESRQAAELALPRVKDRINKGAFIVAP